MAVSGVTANDKVGNVGPVDAGGVQGASGGGFALQAGGAEQAGSKGTSTVDLDWGGMDLDQFKDVAEGAGMDPNSPQVEAAFDKAADKDGILSPQEFMDNFGSAVKNDDGRNVTLDNAAFQDAVGKAAEGDEPKADEAGGSCSGGGPDANKEAGGSCSGAGGAGGAEGAQGAEPTGEAATLLNQADKNKDGVIDETELKAFLKAAGIPDSQVEQMASQLMSELGEGGGIKTEDLQDALQEAGGDLSSKEGLKKALETVAGSESGQGSRSDQNGSQPGREQRDSALAGP